MARSLARSADVVIENFRTGALDARGLGYDEVVRDNAGVVHCSITGLGSGAGAGLPGYDFLVKAVDVLTATDATTVSGWRVAPSWSPRWRTRGPPTPRQHGATR